jgi:hypothetical protein
MREASVVKTVPVRMKIRIGNRPEFGAGVFFLVVGLIGTFLALQYRLGTPTRMGPGFFPLLVSALLGLLGLGAMTNAISSEITAPIGNWPLIPLMFVVGAILAFAVLVDRWGLLASVLVLVVLACYQGWRQRPLEVLLIACVLAAASAGIFVYGLKLPFTVY